MRRGRGGRGGAPGSSSAPGAATLATVSSVSKQGMPRGTPSLLVSNHSKSPGAKGVSFSSSVESYCYAMDTLPVSSELKRVLVGHAMDDYFHDDIKTLDGSLKSASIQASKKFGKPANLPTCDLLGYNYQRTATCKVGFNYYFHPLI